MKDRRQRVVVFAATSAIVLPLAIATIAAKQASNPLFASLGIESAASALQAGGNMEGKVARLGIVDSGLWTAVTTGTSNGSVNAMHDSFTPPGGLIPMWLMHLGENVFGGVGSGLYGIGLRDRRRVGRRFDGRLRTTSTWELTDECRRRS